MSLQFARRGSDPQTFTSPGRDILNLFPVWLEDLLNRERKAASLGCPEPILDQLGIDSGREEFWDELEQALLALWKMAELSAQQPGKSLRELLSESGFASATPVGRLTLMYFLGVRAAFTFLATVRNFPQAENVQTILGYFRELCRIDPESNRFLFRSESLPEEFSGGVAGRRAAGENSLGN